MDKQEIYRILSEAYFSENPDEKDALPYVADILKDARSFLDIGASLGQFTRIASHSMQSGQVVAVEADPVRFEELERNCARWSGESRIQIRALNAAVSDVRGKVRFQSTNSNVSGGLVRHRVDGQHDKVVWTEVEVSSVTIDDICSGEAPGFIKMDIEGAELAALQGANAVLSAKRTKLLVEIHTFPELGGKENLKKVLSLMLGHGYEFLPFFGKHLFAPKGTFRLAEAFRCHSDHFLRRVRNRLGLASSRK